MRKLNKRINQGLLKGLLRRSPNLWLILMIIMFINSDAMAKWSISGSIQTTKGNYFYNDNISSHYLNLGVNYQLERWGISVNIPIVSQDNDLISRSGEMFLPTDQSGHDVEADGRSHHGNMMNGGHISHFEVGFGDLFLYGEYRLVDQNSKLPAVYLNMQLKLPTASTAKGFGTGELDYGGGLSLRKALGSYVVFSDFGYLVLGDMENIKYNDPFTFGAGLGKFLMKGKTSLLLYYQTYSRILDDYDPPRQISFGVSTQTSQSVKISAIGLAGLSESSPDFSLLIGFDFLL